MSINFARSRDPAFYLIAVRILLNQSIIVYFFRTTSSSSFFFFLLSSSSSLFRRFRPPTGQRDLRVVVVRSISSKRVVNGRNDVHDDERVRVSFFFLSFFLSLSLSLVLSTQKMEEEEQEGKKERKKKKHKTTFFVVSEKKNVVLTSAPFDVRQR